jgi:ferrous iron transport protein B
VERDHQKLDFLGFDRETVVIESRYLWIKRVCRSAVRMGIGHHSSRSDKIDAVVTHRFWGIAMFFALMAMIFQAMFAWANIPMRWIAAGFDGLASMINGAMPPGDLRELIVHGGLGGISAVVTFLPQILFLFLFLALLEGTGYMARAAFLMDRLMSKVGLNGKSFIPLLSSFACAIPGIMATRTIDNSRDRLATMMVAPLMSCSARLPVYALLIAAFVPNVAFFGFLSLPGIVLFGLYLLGFLAAIGVAWVFKKTFLKGATPAFIIELPPYRVPTVRSVLLQLWEKGASFLRRAGTIILGVSIVLWFLASYPKLEHGTPSEQLRHSFAGTAAHLLEPAIKPLGFDWRIGIGLIGSLLQREVFVSTLGTIYNIQDAQKSEATISLQEHLRTDRDPESGAPTFTLLTALCVMIYYALAMQCMSTVIIMYRETGGWKWPAIQFAYMTVLAYGVTFLAYRIGLAAGLGG